DFIAGAVDTGFIEERLESLAAPGEPSRRAIEAAAAALNIAESADASPWSPAEGLAGFRLNAPRAGMRLACNGHIYQAPLDADLDADVLIADDGNVVIFEAGEAFVFSPPVAKGGDEASAVADGAVRSPMPGRIVSV